MKAVFEGQVIAETDAPVIVEGNLYYPPDSINKKYFTHNPQTTVCGWKGTASYYDITNEATGKVFKGGAWYYATPKPAAKNIEGYLAFYPQVQHVE